MRNIPDFGPDHSSLPPLRSVPVDPVGAQFFDLHPAELALREKLLNRAMAAQLYHEDEEALSESMGLTDWVDYHADQADCYRETAAALDAEIRRLVAERQR